MPVEYVELVDYLAIAAEVTGIDPVRLARVAKVNLVDSALHAPAAGFGDTDLYSDFVDKAAVTVVDRSLAVRAVLGTSPTIKA